MPVIQYRITLLEPAIFTALQGEPNSSVSFDYVPGSTLRGLLIGVYGTQAIDAGEPTTQRLFFSGETRFLNAYIVEEQTQQRTLPVPGSWQRNKDGDDVILDGAPNRGQTDAAMKTVRGYRRGRSSPA